ncbi:triple tyrosine motif-containing protein [Aestuariibaculum sp. YM273]|uniref:helix-turn-helix and ligand-binding sensor domain-containing protein n=1 Tax=Aestuariibaculum sp. YM273 TaxID=3070659 RepID=UPI0027DB6BD2|nr:triple tyrosine motif-containing protein [Aestuariibaculum sp. YM273]WMI64915.1 triple tyrosine motif-containing protein [Aestuariibaculum sp. YM273]
MCFVLTAQEHPPIQIYTPTDYGAENQNWSISQSQDKYIYVANNKGLLEFNGAKWTVYESPNKTIVRSVKVIDDYIYTGSYREFGYWNRSEKGVLEYTSLASQLKIDFLEDEEVWNILDVEDFILFQTLKRIYVFNKTKNSVNIIESNSGIYKIFKIKEGVYFQKPKEGVFEIVNGQAKLVTSDNILKNNLLVNIFNHQNKTLFQTEDKGFFELKGNDLIQWEIPANKTLLNDRIYSSIKLEDDSFILGSISNGIIHITASGEINYQINQNNGLSNNTVLSVFEDVDNNIWLGLENGINCVNIKSPFRIYNDEKGEIGSVNTSIVYGDKLYIGTNQGLFYKEFKSNHNFQFIAGTQGAVWCLKNIDNTLFCGHNSGTFIIQDDRATLIADVLGTWDIKSVKNHENLLIQGNYSGLNILEKKNDSWLWRNTIENFDISSRYFEMINTSELFVSHEYKGVFKVKLDQDYNKVINVEQDRSVDKDVKTSLIKFGGDILYTQSKGVFKYDLKTEKFLKDTIKSKLFHAEDYTSGKLVYTKQTNKLWGFSQQGLSYLSPGKLSNTLDLHTIALPGYVRNDVSGYENITYLENNKYLYGTTTGYIVIDLNVLQNKPHKVHLNLVSNRNLKGSQENVFVKVNEVGQFKNNDNNLEFHFSVPVYEKFSAPEYQYKLEGIYDDWSQWSTKSEVFFENLPFGDYKFSVRSRLGNEISENIEGYSFSIARPWYLSNTAIIGYMIAVALFSIFMHHAYKRYYKRQREKLLYKTQRELELKELENKEQIMRHNNEKLKQDIESKNRELSLSTMNLIKKNEFLNNLKKELKKIPDDKNLNNVVKIIDKNLNNTDDWQTFEEAFNNADKDFLKKIKTLHPSLTSNDLRLCTYLRLNLSSKEIAPLLNISPRSVEVKRYRLRKKIDLPHDASLTDYILKI